MSRVSLEFIVKPIKWMQSMMQPFPTKTHLFLLNFSLISVFQETKNAYLIGVMSTLQHRFGFSGTICAWIIVAENFSNLLLTPLVGHWAKTCNRAKMIAYGQIVVGFATSLSAIPYLIYPTINTSHPLNSTLASDNQTSSLISDDVGEEYFEARWWHMASTPANSFAVILLLISSMISGLGKTPLQTIGLPCIDDHVKKSRTALAIGTTTAIRNAGPALGYCIASLCLKYHENLGFSSSEHNDAWIGAWWLGFIIIGCLMFLCSLPLFWFTESRKPKAIRSLSRSTSVKDPGFRASLRRIAKNPVFIMLAANAVLRLNGIGGAHVIRPKYMEIMYGSSASSASLLPGTTDVVAGALGVALSGLMITLLHPTAKSLIIYTIGVESVFNGAMISSVFLGCFESVCTQKVAAYVGVLAIGKLAASTARTGNELLLLRSVSSDDKTMALGVFLTLKSILGYIPYPHLFWWLVDHSCVSWKKVTRGQHATCSKYDLQYLNISVHGAAFGFMTLGTIFTIGLLAFTKKFNDIYGVETQTKEVTETTRSWDPEDGQVARPLVNGHSSHVAHTQL